MRRKALLVSLGLMLGIVEIFLGRLALPSNVLGAFLIFIGLGYCIGGSFFLAFSRAPMPGRGLSTSDRTLLFLAPGALIILLIVPLEYLFLPQTLPRAQAMQGLGLILITLGIALRIWTRAALKEAYQGNLQVLPGQSLVTGGPYRWLRHPGYFAFGLQALGLAIGFSSLSGLAGVALLFVGLLGRLRLEEEMLATSFGETYLSYASRTRRLIPWIW